jgi:hypothetical protein
VSSPVSTRPPDGDYSQALPTGILPVSLAGTPACTLQGCLAHPNSLRALLGVTDVSPQLSYTGPTPDVAVCGVI